MWKKTYETKNDCPPIEKIIWGHVATECGDFSGINELGYEDILMLKLACESQISQLIIRGK